MEANIGAVYYGEINSSGIIDYPKHEVLQIMVGDTIIFHINGGSPFSFNTKLLINFPRIEGGSLKYSLLNPHKAKIKQANNNNKENIVLTVISPKQNQFGALDFEVQFQYPGSFFYQLEYFDTKLNEISKIIFV